MYNVIVNVEIGNCLVAHSKELLLFWLGDDLLGVEGADDDEDDAGAGGDIIAQ